MNTTLFRWIRSGWMLPGFAALCFTASLLTAQVNPDGQRRPGAPPGERPANPPEGERQGVRGPRGDRPPGEGPGGGNFGFNLNLTEEQRTAFREASESVREEMTELSERMRDARREFQELIYAEKPDAKKIQKQAEVVGKIDGELAVVRSKVFTKVRSKLTEEQIEQMKRMPGEFAFRAFQGGFGREGFRGPGGPRPPGDGAPPDGRPRRPSAESDKK